MTNAARKGFNNTPENSTINIMQSLSFLLPDAYINTPSLFVWDKHDKQQMSMRIGIVGHEHAAHDENLLDARTNL